MSAVGTPLVTLSITACIVCLPLVFSEEGEKPVAGLESSCAGAWVAEMLEDGFLGGEIGFEVLVRDGRAGVPEPQGDRRQIGACLEEVHRGGVPQRVGRDVLVAQRWAITLGVLDGPVEPVPHSGAGYRGTGEVGEDRRLGASVDLVQPRSQPGCGVLPQRDDSFLASLAVQKHGGLSFQ